MARGDLTDEEWDVIAGLLPLERGRKFRSEHDNRRFLNGMLYVLRVACLRVSESPGQRFR
ncbi:transposase [Novosphingobium sp. fls2-241-R2A-195]|uniref:transposase n=1 Tax=Novosphingobium sp. fls2-241-R2A-195 TaxID=3040296 RepID=UPI00254F1C9D|nr:transposase [Novosphingobium sp. fls2-241-R2A-195]